MFDRHNPAPVSPAFNAAHPAHDGKAGANGWPIVPSLTFPGEGALACPACGSRDVILTVRSGAYGTAPGGRWRMGDNGGHELNACATCGHTSDGRPYVTGRK